MKLSVIFSTFNEEKNQFFNESLELLSKYQEIEIIIIDYHSTDKTSEIAASANAIFKLSSSNSRGKRLDEGLRLSTAPLILFHHPRSKLQASGVEYLLKDKNLLWGGFDHKFDSRSILLSFTSWYSNNVRADIREIFYLDHCIYCTRDLMKRIGGFPHDSIFEDTEVSLKLRDIAPSKRLPYQSMTSSIRFKTNGEWRQAILNQVMKVCYYLKIDQEKMNKIYEFGLNLNSRY